MLTKVSADVRRRRHSGFGPSTSPKDLIAESTPGLSTPRLITDRLSALDWRNWDLIGERLYYIERENQKNALLRRVDLSTGADEVIRTMDNVPLESGLSVTSDETSAYVTTIISAEADLMLLEGFANR